jgi:hypothetical protein
VFANTPAGNCIVELDGESSNIVDVDTICMVPLGTDQADLSAAGTYLYGSAYLADNDSAIDTWFSSEVAKDTSATTEVDDTRVFGNTSIEFQVHGVIGSMAITAKRT